MQNEREKKKITIFIFGLIVLVTLTVALLGSQFNKITSQPMGEIARSMTYPKVNDGDEKVTGTNNGLEFDAFFLRDLNNDGIADGIRGSSRKVGEEDTLYMELNVLTNGRLENGVIKIEGDNFYLKTAIPRDTEIKESAIGSNIREIKLNTINTGTQKLLTAIICSGDYNYASTKTSAIGKDTSKYSGKGKVILTGTFISDDGSINTPITKEVEFDVDWHGTVKAEMPSYLLGNNLNREQDISTAIDEENETFTVRHVIGMQEVNNELNIKTAHIETEIPQLNGYNPDTVKVTGNNVTFKYEPTTRKLTAESNAKLDGSKVITTQAYDGMSGSNRYNRFNIEIVYPLKAYQEVGSDTIEHQMTVKGYYEGYNNEHNEFPHPHKSNVVSATFTLRIKNPSGTVASFDVIVGKYVYEPSGRYIVSKEKPLRIYNGLSEKEDNDVYTVRWYGYTGSDGADKIMVMKETKDNEAQVSDEFLKTGGQYESMENVTSNIGISFSNASSILGEDGEIKVFDDETGELLVTFNKSNWNQYSESNPYRYERPVKHIRIETSKTKASSSLYVYNIKKLDDEYITTHYTEEAFDELQEIRSTLNGYLDSGHINTDTHSADYEAPYTIASIALSKDTLSTQETEKNFKITLKAEANTAYNQVLWQNGAFLVKLPKDIVAIDIENVSATNGVQVVSSEQYKEGENCYIKINTENNTPTTFDVIIDCNITPDPRITTQTEQVELQYSNANAVVYWNKVQDTNDVNGNLNTLENIGKATKSLSLVSPSSLLTSETITEYDSNNSTTIAPQIASVEKAQGSAKINIQLTNNYSNTISEVIILGRIPSTGNKYVINGGALDSDFNTTMKGKLTLPEGLQSIAKVYYSDKIDATEDVTLPSNNWKQDITDFTNIKSYLIDLGTTKINKDAKYEISYEVTIPTNLNYNQVSYSHHAVYFSLDTTEGRYPTQTEPNKVGLMIAKQYDLELIKYQKGKGNIVSGATYYIKEEGQEEGKTRVTDINGKLTVKDLYVDRTYVIKEIKSPVNYELNETEVKFRATEESGVLKLVDNQTTKDKAKNIQVIDPQNGEGYKVQVQVEDEVKASLKIVKKAKGTSNKLNGVRFKITGKNYEDGRSITTNASGEATLTGLSIGETYTLEEIKADGYYLASKITFTIKNNGGSYSVEKAEENGQNLVTSAQVQETANIPTLTLNIDNEKIPEYTLKIKKVVKGKDEPLAGAKFRLFKGTEKIDDFTTDAGGNITIPNLYQYEETRNLDQTYTLKEILAPDGYAQVKDITFYVTNVDGILTMKINEGKIKEQTADGNTVTITIEDSKSFKLIKKDGETNKPLPNTKFAIYNVDDGTEQLALDSKYNILGEKEEINGKTYYTLTTNAQGEIEANLREGLYKAVEIKTEDEKYEITNNVYYFGIGASREAPETMSPTWATSIGGSNNDRINSVAQTSDGGYIVGGCWYGKPGDTITIGKYTFTSNSTSTIIYTDGLLIKYSSNGEVEWATSFGGSYDDEINSVAQTSDGGYIVGGYFAGGTITVGEYELTDSDSLPDGLLIKYRENGEVEWAKSFGYSDGSEVRSVAELDDGDYIVGGYWQGNRGKTITIGSYKFTSNTTSTSYVYSDGLIIKYSKAGEVEWATSFGGSYSERINSVAETSDGGYIVGGSFGQNFSGSSNITIGSYTLNGNGNADGLLIKYGANNEIEWATSFGGSGADYINSVAQTNDGGYIVGGYFSSSSITVSDYGFENNGSYDGLLIKYRADNSVEWATSFGGSYNDQVTSVAQTSDGEYIVGGTGEVSLKKYNSVGELEWSISSGDIYSVLITNDGGYIVGGSFNSNSITVGNYTLNNNSESSWSDGLLVKYEPKELANPVAITATSIGKSNDDKINAVVQTSDGGYIVGGTKEVGLRKYSSSNELEWNVSSIDVYSVAETKDQGYIVGEGSSLRKYNSLGELEWNNSIGTNSSVTISSVSATSDGGCIVGGSFGGIIYGLETKGSSDGLLIKYSEEGEVEWATNPGGEWNDYVTSVAQTSDGGYIVGGYFYSSSITLKEGIVLKNNDQYTEYSDGLLVKYNGNGNVEWATSIGGISNDKITSVSATSDGGYIVGGYFGESSSGSRNITIGSYTLNGNGYADGLLIKYNSDNDVEWATSFGGNDSDLIESVAQTSDGGYIVGGYFESSSITVGDYILKNNSRATTYFDGLLIKYKPNENTNSSAKYVVDWAKSIEGTHTDQINSAIELQDGTILAGGCYYSPTIEIDGKTLTNNSSSTSYSDGMLLKVANMTGVPEVEELEVKNYVKEFKITTDVEEIDGKKGGTISGEDSPAYEIVKYGESSTLEIKMTPEDNTYEIIKITINGVEQSFTPTEDGSYTLDKFHDMKENKHVVVTYAKKSNKIVVKKVDSKTKAPIEGVEFKIDQIDERAVPPQNVIGTLTPNGATYTETQITTEVTGLDLTLEKNGDYYFITREEDGSYVPNNGKNYTGTGKGIDNQTAHSYIKIDLTGKTGQYAVVVNASVSSESVDYGYATITKEQKAPEYSSKTGQFMYISGTQTAKNYTSEALEGNNVYYLHLGYRKDSSADRNDDQVVINSVKVYNAENHQVTYNFADNGGEYKSNNQAKPNTTANSYMQINLTGYTGKYNLSLKAKVSSQSSDYGYATVTTTDKAPSYSSNTSTRFVYISGTSNTEYQEYSTVLDGGQTYYLHLGYYKNATGDDGDDCFTVKDVRVTLNDSELYHAKVTTNSEGKGTTQVPLGKYTITEMNTPEGYIPLENPVTVDFKEATKGIVSDPENVASYESEEFVIENVPYSKVTVHHYLKQEDGTETTNRVAEDDHLTGKPGETYQTKPHLELQKYELQKDSSGAYITPNEASGKYKDTEIVVIYYYTLKKIPLTVHHYIVGTETKVPLANGNEAQDEKSQGTENQSYTTKAKTATELNPKYEFEEVAGNAEGTYQYEEVIVTYYYDVKDSPGVLVHHVDTTTKKSIADDVRLYSDGTAKYGDSYQTEPSEEIPANYKLAVTPGNANGTMTEKLTEVTYEYSLEDPEITKESITKEGTEAITEPSGEVSYTINYTATVNKYIGKIQLTVVDTLPFEIDQAKSELAGGDYNPDTHQITWQEVQDEIDTYEDGAKKIEFSKTIKVVFTNVDLSKPDFTNSVNGKVKLFTPEKQSPGATDEAKTKLDISTEVTAIKIWNHDNNSYEIPSRVKLQLKKKVDGVETLVQEQVITVANKVGEDTNKWSYTFTDLPKYDDKGNLVEYNVYEVEAGPGELAYYDSSINQAEKTITNTYAGPIISQEKTVSTARGRSYVGETEKLTYTITVTNAGGRAKDVVVKDSVPQGTAFVTGSIKVNGNSTYNLNGSDINLATKTAADLSTEGITVNVPAKAGSTNGTVRVSFEVTVSDLGQGVFEGTITNRATVDGKETTPVETPIKKPNITPQKSYEITRGVAPWQTAETRIDPTNPTEVKVNDIITYKIQLTNTGKALGIAKVKDEAPTGTEFVAGSIKVNGVDSYTVNDTEAKLANNTVSVAGKTEADLRAGIDLPLGVGQTVTLEFKVQVKDDTDGEKIPNTATVNRDTEKEGNPELPTNKVENTYVEPIIVGTKDIETERGNSYVSETEIITYTITVTNKGGLAKDVVIKDEIPAGTTFVPGSIQVNGSSTYSFRGESVTLSQKTENDLKNGITVNVARKAEGGADGVTTLSFKVKVNDLASEIYESIVSNTATVDDSPTNGVEKPIKKPNINIEKTYEITRGVAGWQTQTTVINPDHGDEVKVNDIITYKLKLVNDGARTGIATVKDEIPNGTEFVAGSIKINGETTYTVAPTPGGYAGTTIDLTTKGEADLRNGIEIPVEVGRDVTLEFGVKVKDINDQNKIPNIATMNNDTEKPGNPEKDSNKVEDTYVEPMISAKKEAKTARQRTYLSETEKITYTITITNKGGLAKDVVVKDNIPSGTTFVPGSIKVNGNSTYNFRNEVIDLTQKNENDLASGITVNVPRKGRAEAGPDGSQIEGADGVTTLSFDVTVNDLEAGVYTRKIENIGNVDGTDTPKVENTVKKPNVHVEKGYTITRGVATWQTQDTVINPEHGDEVKVNDVITYTIKLTNDGAETGIATVKDEAPEGTEFVPGSIKVNGQDSYTLEGEMASVVGDTISVAGMTEDNLRNGIELPVEVGKIIILEFKVQVKDLVDQTKILNTATVNKDSEKPGNPEGPTNEVENTYVEPIISEAKKVETERNRSYVGETEILTYTITITNKGGLAKDVVVKDNIPTGTKFVAGSIQVNGSSTYNFRNEVVDLSKKTADDLANGITVNVPRKVRAQEQAGQIVEGADGVTTLSFKVEVTDLAPDTYTGTITNKATVDDNPTNDVENTVKKPNIHAEKSYEITRGVATWQTAQTVIDPEYGDEVKVNDIITYYITLTNNGDVAGIATVKDEAPKGTTFVQDSIKVNGQNSYTITSEVQDVTGTEISVAGKTEAELRDGIKLPVEVNKPVILEFQVKVNNIDDQDKIPNTATLNKDTEKKENPEGPTNEVENTYVEPVISEAKTVETERDRSYVGETEIITYTITITNKGGLAKDVIVKDNIPAGTTFVPGSIQVNGSSTYRFRGQDINLTQYSDSDLADGITVNVPRKGREGVTDGADGITTLSFKVVVNDLGENTFTGTINNTANVDNTDTNTTTNPVKKPNVHVEKSYEITRGVADWQEETTVINPEYGDEVKVNDIITYKIKLTNDGTETGLVTVKDEAPEGTTFVPDSIKVNGAYSYTITSEMQDVTGTEISVAGKTESDLRNGIQLPVEVNKPVILEFQVKVNNIDDQNKIQNTATVNKDTEKKGNLEGPTNEVENTYVEPIISEAKTVETERHRSYVGETEIITYTITITNKGGLAKDVVVKDNIPTGTKFVAGSIQVNGSSTYRFRGQDVDLSKYDETNLSSGITVNVPRKGRAQEQVEGPVEEADGVTTLSFKVEVTDLAPDTYTGTITNKATVDDNPTNDVENTVKKPNIHAEKAYEITRGVADWQEEATVINPEYGDEVKVNDIITYYITLTNDGDVAGIATVKDEAPKGTTFVPDSIKVNGQDSYTITSEVQDVTGTEISVAGKTETDLKNGIELPVEVNKPVILEFKVKVDNIDDQDKIPNTATVNKDTEKKENPEEPTNEVENTYVEPVISQAKTVETERRRSYVGETEILTYTITITNKGGLAKDVVVKDNIPAGTTFVPGSIKVNGANTYNFREQDIDLSTLTEDDLRKGITVNVPRKGRTQEQAEGPVEGADGVTTLSFEVVVNDLKAGTYAGTITNEATVDDNPTGKVENTVKKPNVHVEKSYEITRGVADWQTEETVINPEYGDEVKVNDIITYKIKLTNDGAETGLVTVKDEAPEGTTFVPDSIKVNGAYSYTITSEMQDVTGTEISVAGKTESDLRNGIQLPVEVNKPVTLEFQVKVNNIEDQDKIPNTATVNKDTEKKGNPEGPTNEVENTYVEPIISEAKTVETERHRSYVGETEIITYTITVTNKGGLAKDVIVRDEAPEGTTFVPGSIKVNGKSIYNFREQDIDLSKLTEDDLREGITINVPRKGREGVTDGADGVTTLSFEVEVNDLPEGIYAGTITNKATVDERETNEVESLVRIPNVHVEKQYEVTRGVASWEKEDTAVTPKVDTEVKENDIITYKIKLTNDGTETGLVTVKDSAPEGTEFIEGSIKVNGENSYEISTEMVDVTGRIISVEGKTEEDLKEGLQLPVEVGKDVILEFKVRVTNLEDQDKIFNTATVNKDTEKRGNPEEETNTVEHKYVEPIISQNKAQTSEKGLNYVVEGEKITYTIVVENDGGLGKVVVVKDKIPTGTTFVAGSMKVNGQSKHTILGEEIDMSKKTVEDLEEGISIYVPEKTTEDPAQTTLSFKVSINELEDGIMTKQIRNQAEVDDEKTNEVKTLINKAKIDYKKTSEPETGSIVKAGDEITYRIEVQNTGTAPKEIEIYDVVPKGTTYVEGSFKLTRGAISAIRRYTIEDLSRGIDLTLSDEEKVTVEFKVTVDEGLENGTVIRNVGEIDGKPTNETEHIVKAPKIEIEKEQSIDNNLNYVVAGDEISYNLIVRNSGDLGGKVLVKDTIPEGTSFVEGSIEINGSKTYTIDEREIDLSTLTVEDLKNGIEVYVAEQQDVLPTVLMLSFKVKVNENVSKVTTENADGADGEEAEGNENEATTGNTSGDVTENSDEGIVGEIINIATAKDTQKPEKDPETSNEVRYPVVTIEKKAQINRTTEEVQPNIAEGKVTADDEITYTITVRNEGTEDAENVEIKDTVPEGTVIKKVNDDGDIKSEKEITWVIEKLKAGEEKTLSFTVIVSYSQDEEREIRNTAYVKGSPSNETVTNYQKPEISMQTSVVKDGDTKITSTESKVYYEIVYTGEINFFVGKATIRIVDKLPYEIDESKSDLDGGKYDRETRTITWEETVTDIDTYLSKGAKVITRRKAISLQYIYEDEENLRGDIENIVTAKTELKEPDRDNPSQDKVVKEEEKQDNHIAVAEIPTKLIVHHYFYDKETEEETTLSLAPDEEREGIVGDNYTTSKSNKVPANYECMNENPEKKEGKLTKTPIEVTYYYVLKDEEAELEVEKEATANKVIERAEPVSKPVNNIAENSLNSANNINTEANIGANSNAGTSSGMQEIYDSLSESMKQEMEGFLSETGTNVNKSTSNKSTSTSSNGTITTNKNATASIENKEKEANKITVVPVLTEEGGAVKYKVTYKVRVDKYIGKIKVSIVDTLQAPINVEASDLKDGNYDAEENTITWEETIENIDTFADGVYERTIVKEISIVYEGQNKAEVLENTVEGKVTTYYPDIHPNKPGEEKEEITDEDTAKVEQDYRRDVIVDKRWDDNGDIRNHRPTSVRVQLTANGEETYSGVTEHNGERLPDAILSEENRWSYTFKDLYKYDSLGNKIEYSVTESEVNEHDLEYYEEPDIKEAVVIKPNASGEKVRTEKIIVTNSYKLVNTEIESSITKDGTTEITTSKDRVKYHITYNALVTDYIGEATLTITDTLPYRIDEKSSNLNGGTYDEDLQTITWVEELGHINTIENGNKEVNFEKEIEVVFTDLDATQYKMENKVKGRIEFTENDTKNEVEDTHETEINIRGLIIVRYVDINTGKDITRTVMPGEKGNEDGEEPIEVPYRYEATGKVGAQYITEKKDIPTYDYVMNSGNTVGNIIEGAIEVIYYYDRSQSGGVTVKYVDEEGNDLLPEERIEGKIDEEYKTEKKDIENYEYVEVTGDEPEGKLGVEPKEVVYHYKKIPARVVVRFLEKAKEENPDENEPTNPGEGEGTPGNPSEGEGNPEQGKPEEKVLAPEEIIEGYVGDNYETTRKAIENYRAAEPEPDNATGKMEKNDQDNTIYVTYYYEKIPSGKITVKYVDIDTDEEIIYMEEGEAKTYREEMQGYVGERYTTSEKEIPYYDYLEDLAPTNKEGIYTEDDDTVVYYYRRLPFNISVEKKIVEALMNGEEVNVRNGKIMKLEVVASKVGSTDIQLRYEIEVRNTGAIDGIAYIEERIPAGLRVSSKTPDYWERANGKLTSKVELKVGESKKLEVVLDWENSSNNFGNMKNVVEITNTENPANYAETNKEDNTSEAEVIISVKTGAEQKILLVLLGTIAISGGLILIYQYETYQKERGREIRHVVLEGKKLVIRKKKQK